MVRRGTPPPRHCEEPGDEAIQSFFSWHDGLLRGVYHRVRIRATRWLAMTLHPAASVARMSAATFGISFRSRYSADRRLRDQSK